jgi:RNA polymerase sigma-70 factor (ECF subfamily)
VKDNIEHIIELCKNEDPIGQKMLYDAYSPLLFAICLRYLKSREDAEDTLIESFYKIFTKIGSYKNEGSFEGWMKRITVNEALMSLRKKNILNLSVELSNINEPSTEENIIDKISYEELLTIMDSLPPGYRTVFNMYLIEGYKHREIADMLNISINTSKSQLILAKKKMRELIKKKQIKYINE